jgi:hypothetical protein
MLDQRQYSPFVTGILKDRKGRGHPMMSFHYMIYPVRIHYPADLGAHFRERVTTRNHGRFQAVHELRSAQADLRAPYFR